MRKHKDDILPNVVFTDTEEQNDTSKNVSPPTPSVTESPKPLTVTEDKEVEQPIVEKILDATEPIKNEVAEEVVSVATMPTLPLKNPSLGRICFERFTCILSNMAFFLVIMTVIMQLASFLAPIFWLILLLASVCLALVFTIFTLGLIFEFAPEFAYGLWDMPGVVLNSMNKMMGLTATLFNLTEYTSIIGICVAFVAIVCNFLCRRKKSVAKIVFLFLIIPLMAFIFYIVKGSGGVQW